jgi:hypothetical protein
VVVVVVVVMAIVMRAVLIAIMIAIAMLVMVNKEGRRADRMGNESSPTAGCRL